MKLLKKKVKLIIYKEECTMDFDKTMFFKVEKNKDIDTKQVLKEV